MEEQARAAAGLAPASPEIAASAESRLAASEASGSAGSELDKVARRNLARFQAVSTKAEEDAVEALCYD